MMPKRLDIIPNTAEAVDFLSFMFPHGPFHLVAIDPSSTGTVHAKTFLLAQIKDMRDWIDSYQGKANLYFHVNALRFGFGNRKAKKEDVSAALHLHVDIDDLTALPALETFDPPPTVILMSGNGYQGFWRLETPVTDLDLVERCNAAIAKLVGGDKCQNADRIMRLPGTVNLPSRKKLSAGKVKVLACIAQADWDRSYAIGQFPQEAVEPPPRASEASGRKGPDVGPIVPVDLDALPEKVGAQIRIVIERGDDPDRPIGSSTPRYPSRSEAVFHVACELCRAKCADEIVAGILINPRLGISASILERGDPGAYAVKQVRSAQAAIGEGWPDADRRGNPRATMPNAVVAARRLGLTFQYDVFRRRKMVNGKALAELNGQLSDEACLAIRGEIHAQFGFDPRPENTRHAIELLCLEHTVHPIREMLSSLVWDGVARIDTWLVDYLGAEDTPLNRAISRIMLIAAVRRVREPGVKFDQIIVIEGPQGSGKSTAVQILAGPGNHSDTEILSLGSREQVELLDGVWLYELSEVEGMSRAEVSKIKAFASRRVDRARAAFAHYLVDSPRQAIFIGTTNDSKYLRDETGNRRFWPVKTTTIKLDGLSAVRDQLWAEAAAREAQKESIGLPEELWADAAEQQGQRLEEDPWIDVLQTVNGTANGDVVQVSNIWLRARLGLSLENIHGGHTKRIASIMEKLGWRRAQFREDGESTRGYRRPKPEDHHDDKAMF